MLAPGGQGATPQRSLSPRDVGPSAWAAFFFDPAVTTLKPCSAREPERRGVDGSPAARIGGIRWVRVAAFAEQLRIER